MKIIVQNHSWGCGVACVAFAIGKTYKHALKNFSKPENAWQCGFMCKDLVEALHRAGLHYEYKYYREKYRSVLKKAGTIVFVGKSPKYPGGHYLIRASNGKWMNPWSNFPEIAPAQGKFQSRLPGRVVYVLFQKAYKGNRM